tara:strand:+ start:878 stop:1246 length:369 start_codon:yes stop_codon:yes gene_type:complete
MKLLACKVCKESKEPELFPVASVTKSGRAGECKACKSARVKKMRTERETALWDMSDKKCGDCGLYHQTPSFFDFHHTDPATKKREVKQIICGSWDTLMKEFSKCVMLCPNCHRERHLKEGWK